ncbi:spermidine/putrescine ABC transporter ATP-binding protein [Corynebacterium tuscaniense]|uniref:Spermidine/putrescine ABC transporter ATP-binding protein n=1 Tax=Corynebacterium tuscaniense TaxID=302449 RepID=A0A2N6T733_9CORY|nr:ABC transporter ATP-binding protein [Corynebacterium tuscaniense]PMC65117.1 spermidine/putrescine ABC transporter ATP-binding protein [Corynebacterium tuscaniense]
MNAPVSRPTQSRSLSDDEVALSVEGVTKKFGPKTAVNDLSLSARRREVFALLGPNGAGKSTTIEMCEGFTTPTSGQINVLGFDPQREPEEVRSRIGIMLQGGGSYSGIRVKEMLDLTASYNKEPLDPTWLMEVLGLEGVAKTTYRRLSGGQQQRLSLALALIGRPELIFLDEPTAGMDAQSRRAVWDLIRALKRDGVTVVLTTHLMDEAESLADYVAIIDHGSLLVEGTPAELIDGSAPSALEIHTDRPLDLVAVAESSTAELKPSAEELVYRLDSAADPSIIASVAAEAARQDVLIKHLGVRRRTLEDVFLDITGRELRS